MVPRLLKLVVSSREEPANMARVALRMQALGALALASAFLLPMSSSAEGRRADATGARAHAVALDGYAQRRGPTPEAVLVEMNRERRRRGLPALFMSRSLNAAAEDRLRDMFEQRYFAHDAPDGTSPFVSLRRRGYRFLSAGENLASGQGSAAQVVEQWMRSPGHRANILGRFEDAGIAIALGSPTGRGIGYTFVALYARPRT
jgi:uncharacterized protein YkwD